MARPAPCFRSTTTVSLSASVTLLALLLVGATEDVKAQSCTPVPTNINCGAAGGCPTIASFGPGAIIAGARQQQITIVGSNFRAGAQVIVTMPNYDPAPLAPDVIVTRMILVNSGMIVAWIDVNRLGSGVRNVDVLNRDCTNSGNSTLNVPGPSPSSVTTRQIFISAATNSLSGSVNVQNLIITYPRDGTVVSQRDDLYAEGVVAGGGTGLVAGVWLWDGNVSEQFTTQITGGESTTIRTTLPLPVFYLGRHTLQMQVTSPQTMISASVRVIVTGGDWSLLRLALPQSAAGYSDAVAPSLLWTPIPGAAKYEVGFSSEPYFRSVTEWREVADNRWRVPEKIWRSLPEGELYWTVRPVDISGEVRNPAPMRAIWHLPGSALTATSNAPETSASGSVLLKWRGLPTRSFYRLTLTRDAAGNDILRSYLTGEPQGDLYAMRDILRIGDTFYWQVAAIAPSGSPIMTGPRQSATVPAAHARGIRQTTPSLVLASVRASAVPDDLGPKISKRSPASGETVASDQPPIQVAFAVAPDSSKLAVSVDNTDVTALSNVSGAVVTYSPVFPFENGEHSIEVDVAADSATWNFKVASKGSPLQTAVAGSPKNDAEVPPKGSESAARAGRVGPQFKTHFGFDPQLGSSPAPSQITTTAGEQMMFQEGRWRLELNGTEALDSVFSPAPARAFGRVQDYLAQAAYDGRLWGISARFGLIAPTMYTDAQYITTATARHAVEPAIRTPAGTFSYYESTDDTNLGGGDASAFHEIIRGAGYEAPLPKEWASFRLMWISARSSGTPSTTILGDNGLPTMVFDTQANPGSGDDYGALVKLHLPAKIEITSEYALSYGTQNVGLNPVLSPDPNFQLAPNVPGPVDCQFSARLLTNSQNVPQTCGAPTGDMRSFGRAWRTTLSWQWKKTSLSFAYRDVSPNFSNPVNPSLSPGSNPNRRGVDASLTQGTPLGNFQLGYQFLESNVDLLARPSTLMNNFTWGWSKTLKSRTQFSVKGHQVRTTSGTLPQSLAGVDQSQLAIQGVVIDQRDVGFNSSVIQQVGSLTLTATASRDWFRNRLTSDICGQTLSGGGVPPPTIPCQNSIVTGSQFSARWGKQSIFQLQANASANWTERDKTTDGSLRVLSAYLMPVLTSKRTGLSLAPLATITQNKGALGSGLLTADLLTSQFGGRISWRLPSILRMATFSLEGSRMQMRDGLSTATIPGGNLVDKRLALLLSFSQDQTQGRL